MAGGQIRLQELARWWAYPFAIVVGAVAIAWTIPFAYVLAFLTLVSLTLWLFRRSFVMDFAALGRFLYPKSELFLVNVLHWLAAEGDVRYPCSSHTPGQSNLPPFLSSRRVCQPLTPLNFNESRVPDALQQLLNLITHDFVASWTPNLTSYPEPLTSEFASQLNDICDLLVQSLLERNRHKTAQDVLLIASAHIKAFKNGARVIGIEMPPSLDELNFCISD
eukprot:m.91062 g.91062  ORF g.91062 m.91062 type:complete len:221 (-) comp12937_c0_seq3:2187-2849(-)